MLDLGKERVPGLGGDPRSRASPPTSRCTPPPPASPRPRTPSTSSTRSAPKPGAAENTTIRLDAGHPDALPAGLADQAAARPGRLPRRDHRHHGAVVTARGDAHVSRRGGEEDSRALLEAHLAGDPDAFGRALRPAPRPALGRGAAHDRPSGGRSRRAPGRADLGLPPGRQLPRRRRRDHVAAPHRGQRLPRPAAASPGAGGRPAARRPRGARRARRRARHRGRRPTRPRRWSPASAGGAVLAALDQLPPDQKAALVLVDMEGYSVAEAAAILEAPTGTVKSRCARGRARLAVLLSRAARGPRRNRRGLPARPIGVPPTRRDARTRAHDQDRPARR